MIYCRVCVCVRMFVWMQHQPCSVYCSSSLPFLPLILQETLFSFSVDSIIVIIVFILFWLFFEKKSHKKQILFCSWKDIRKSMKPMRVKEPLLRVRKKISSDGDDQRTWSVMVVLKSWICKTNEPRNSEQKEREDALNPFICVSNWKSRWKKF